MAKHPMQKIVLDSNGTSRFQENKIVSFLLDQYKPNLNGIATLFASGHREDYEQLMMLIGYSVSGFGDLSSSNRRRVATADRIAEKMTHHNRSGEG